MASTSLFEAAQTATSDVSSVEDNVNPQTSESRDPEHPRLSELKRQARLHAEHQHKAVEVRKLRKGKDKRGRIVKNRRQTSNIKSAEICRAAKGRYIELLEDGIRQEEEFILQTWKDMLDQVTDNVILSLRVSRVEELYNAREARKLWSRKNVVENAVPDEVVDDFFPASGSEESQWDHRKDGCSSAYEGEIELPHWDEDEWMDFEEMSAPVTPPPPPPVELDIPKTPQQENQYAIHCGAEKILLSPVTIADDEHEPEEELFGIRL